MATKRKPIKRLKKAVNITLSDDARTFGEQLAASRGIKFTQLVEWASLDRQRKAARHFTPEITYASLDEVKKWAVIRRNANPKKN